MFTSERRFFTLFLKRLAVVSMMLCVGCSAQQNSGSNSSNSSGKLAIPHDTSERVERQVRSYFNLPPDVNVAIGTPSPSDFPNYDLVSITMSRDAKSESADFLLSKDGKTLIRITKFDLTKNPYVETMNQISLLDRPVRGNPDAKVTIVNFDDFECPFCARMHTTLMNQVLPQYQDKVKIVYKDYPLLQMHPWAMHAANDANCLAKQSGAAYWELADYLHANQRTINPSQGVKNAFDEIDKQTIDFGRKNGVDVTQLQACLKAQSDTAVKASMAEGDKLGVNATPTLFINGERLEGAMSADEVKAALNSQLLAAGVQPPVSQAASGTPAHQETSDK